jgi:hypothetical protein
VFHLLFERFGFLLGSSLLEFFVIRTDSQRPPILIPIALRRTVV